MRLPWRSCPAENVRGMMIRRLILPGGYRSSSAGNMILCRELPEAKKRQPDSGCLFFASGCNSRYALLPRRPVFFLSGCPSAAKVLYWNWQQSRPGSGKPEYRNSEYRTQEYRKPESRKTGIQQAQIDEHTGMMRPETADEVK